MFITLNTVNKKKPCNSNMCVMLNTFNNEEALEQCSCMLYSIHLTHLTMKNLETVFMCVILNTLDSIY